MSEQLVLHHTYALGQAFDVSEHGNHGELLGGVAPTPFDGEAGTLEFFTSDGRVLVQPSASFTGMRSVRAHARFQVRSQIVTDRQTLVEGDGSFALYHEGFTVTGTILDATGTWNDTFLFNDFPMFQPGRWYDVEFHHDGVSHTRLWLDGDLVRERFDVPGPVRDVGPGGVVIGRALDGWIDSARVWTYDPESDIDRFVDHCCLDRRDLDHLLHEARDEGWDGDRWTRLIREILDLGTEIDVATRAGDAERSSRLSRLTRDGMLAIAHKDSDGLHDVFGGVYELMREQLSDREILEYGERAIEQLRSSPFERFVFRGKVPDVDALRSLAGVLCLDGLIQPGDRPHRPPPHRPDGDPHTDLTPGTLPVHWTEGAIDR